jgi:hypothetical protein
MFAGEIMYLDITTNFLRKILPKLSKINCEKILKLDLKVVGNEK